MKWKMKNNQKIKCPTFGSVFAATPGSLAAVPSSGDDDDWPEAMLTASVDEICRKRR